MKTFPHGPIMNITTGTKDEGNGWVNVRIINILYADGHSSYIYN